MEDHTVSLIKLNTYTHNEVNDDSILSSKTISKQSSVVIPNSNKKDQKFWEKHFNCRKQQWKIQKKL